MALSQEFSGDDLVDARERFFREAETAGRLQHQNIVTIFDAGEEHDLAYIAMEFLKGKDLLDFCKDGNLLPVPRVLSIVARVAEALAYAHRQNVVHRDIKPANIMYEHDSDTVKVTDFGIARITDSSKTKTGLVLGTPSFMSPEQLAGKKVDGRSDLYSLGVMLFQMLTGVLPFRGDSMAELMYKIANEEAADLRTIRSDLPESLANLVALAMAKRPETRYQDGDQFAADLRSVLAELGGGASGPAGATGRTQTTNAASAPQAGGHERTAVLATSSVAASAQFEKTVVHNTQAAKPADDAFQKTAVHQAPASARPMDDFEKTAVHQSRPDVPAHDAFEKTAVHQRPPKPDDRPGPAAPTVPDVEI
jgi:serine/threonine-protein kinase